MNSIEDNIQIQIVPVTFIRLGGCGLKVVTTVSVPRLPRPLFVSRPSVRRLLHTVTVSRYVPKGDGRVRPRTEILGDRAPSVGERRGRGC